MVPVALLHPLLHAGAQRLGMREDVRDFILAELRPSNPKKPFRSLRVDVLERVVAGPNGDRRKARDHVLAELFRLVATGAVIQHPLDGTYASKTAVEDPAYLVERRDYRALKQIVKIEAAKVGLRPLWLRGVGWRLVDASGRTVYAGSLKALRRHLIECVAV